MVAFARLYKVDINIHQLNLPIWTITGGDYNVPTAAIKNNNHKNDNIRNKIKQLHLSYHNNEHYSSIRTIGDNSNKPTDIYFQNGTENKPSLTNKTSKYYDDYEDNFNESFDSISISKSDYASSLNGNEYSANENKNIINNKNGFLDKNETDYELELKVEQIMDITKCMDIGLIKEKLIEYDNNVDLTISALYNYDHAGSIYSLSNLNEVNHSESNNIKNNKNSKSSVTKSDKKREKKQRQMERQKQKVAEENAKLSSNTNDVNFKSDNKSQSDNHNSIDEPSYSVSINVNTKSI